MSIQVKICGITNIDDALDAVELGADYLGLNFYPDSKRFIKPEELKKIINEIPFSIAKVGIFVNMNEQFVIDVATQFNLDFLQFHGDETPEFCNQFGRPYIRAIRPKNKKDIEGLDAYKAEFYLVDSFVQDAFGGTGVVSNWDIAREVQEKYGKIFLSGGLTTENIEMAINSVKPFAVDVASGVELSPGKKDYHKIEEFIKKVKRVDGS